MNSGGGVFATPVNYSGFNIPESVVVGDFDSDTYPDIAVANGDFNGRLSVLLNNRSGGFSPVVNYTGNPGSKQLAMGDFNGDNYPDLIVSVQSRSVVAMYTNNGMGGFGTSTTFSTGSTPYFMVTADFNHDGKVDVAVSTAAGIGVLLNDGSGSLNPVVSYSIGEGYGFITAGDINGDQVPDLILSAGNPSTYQLNWLINRGDGTFGPAFSAPTLGTYGPLVTHDFNNDTKQDVAIALVSGKNVQLLYNTITPITSQLASGSVVCAGSTVTASVSVTGTVTGYQWFYNGTALAGQTTATLSLTNVQPAQSGNYDVVLTSSCVSQTSTSFSLTVPSLTVTAAPSLTIVSGNSVTLTASGASSYSWSTGASTSAISVSATGTYSVTGVSAGCSSTTSVVVKGQFTIGDRVYFDINGNGLQNAGEPGIPGTVINALWFGPDNSAGGGDDVPYSTTTGADGIWSLTVLDTGTYRVSATPPANQGWVITDAFDNGIVSGTNPVTPLITASRNNIDFGFRSTGQAGGLVFNDIDRNGSQNAPSGEQGRSGVTVQLRYDANTNGTLTDPDDGSFTGVTNAAGVYSFSFLPPGTYQAEILTAGLPANSQPTYDPDGVATPYTTTLTLTLGQSLTTVNFGYATVCYPVIYVTQAGAGSRDGSSWSNAYSGTALQTAIDAAAGCNGQVWVATGTYKPTTTTGPNSRTISFAMRNNVAIYGGFLGSETALSGRPAVNPVTGNPSSSTLSGDIGTLGNSSDNSYHVIHNTQSLSLNQSAVIDGFVITGGNGNSVNCPDYYGAAIHNDGASPTIRNCLFTRNNAGWGGAVMNRLRQGDQLELTTPVITNCVFSSNTAGSGGGMFNLYSQPAISNVIFRNNYASNGGAMFNRAGGSPQVVNSTFASNSALNGGAIFSELSSNPQLTNCSFRDNTANTEGGVIYNATYYNSSSATLVNCVLFNNGGSHNFYNDAPQNTTQLSSISLTYSLFEPASVSVTGVDVSGPGNLTANVSPFSSTTGTDLAACSPAINAGLSSATALTGFTTDLAGNPRRYQNGVVDMGAYEFQGDGPPLSFSLLGSGTATCTASPTITLSGSETGVSYQLRLNGADSGPAVPGTGSPISFGPQSLSGTYTVLATTPGSCTLAMAGSATVVSSTATITVTAPAIQTGTTGVSFTQNFSVTNGVEPYTVALNQGTLPAGLTLSNAGQIDGIPTQSGTFAITILTTGGTSCSALSSYSLTINCPSLTVNTPTVATATAGINVYNAYIWSITGISTYSFSFGSLPPGLVVSTTYPNYREIGGIPTQQGVFPVSLTVTNEYGCSYVAPPFAITVNCPSLTVIAPTVTTAAAGEGVYNFDFGWFIAGTSSYSSTFSGLPPGFIIDSPGPNYWRLVGIPTQTGVFPVSLTVTNEFGCSFVAPPFNLSVVVVCPSLTVTAPAVATAAVGESVRSNSFEWLITSTSNYTSAFSGLPPGLHVDSPGPNFWRLLGTPTQAGVFSVSLTATTDYGCSFVVPPFSITVNCALMGINTTTDPSTCGATGSISFATTLPDGSYSLSYVGTGSPRSITVSGSIFSLTGLTAGSYSSFSLSQPGLGCVLEENTTILLTNPAAMTVTAPAVTTGTIGVSFSQSFSVTNGVQPYTFSQLQGTLPPGLTLTTGGLINGVPTQSGTFAVTVLTTDASSCSVLSSYSLTVNCPSLTVNTPTVATATAGINVQNAFIWYLTGTSTYTFDFGGLPPGLSVVTSNPNYRVISGTPTQAGVFPVSLTVTNQYGCSFVADPFNLTVNCPTMGISSTANPASCGATGSISFTTTLPSGSYSLSYVGTGSPKPVTVSGGTFIVPNLPVGSYSNFSLSQPGTGCVLRENTTVSLTNPASPTPVLTAGNGGTLTCARTSLTLTASGGNSYTFVRAGGGGIVSQNAAAGTAIVNMSGTYSVTVANAAGCTSQTSIVIDTDNAPPSLSITPSAVTLTCASTSAVLSVVGSGDARWSTGAQSTTIRVASAGTYSVTLSSGNGCTSVSSATVVSATAAPGLSINSSSTLISCASPTVSLSAVGVGSARWSTGSLSPVLSVTATGTYSVTLTDAGSCTATASAVVSGSLLGTATVTAGGTLGCGVLTTSVQVQASGATSYTLLGPGGYSQTNSTGIFSVSAGGSYTGVAGQSGCVVSNTVVVTEGGVQPTISSAQATGTLGSGVCSLSVRASGYGDRYVLTSPSGYVFSVVFRTAGEHTAVFPDVIKPGTYTLTVYSGNCVVSQNVAVSGTACP